MPAPTLARRDTVLFRPLGWFVLRTTLTARQAGGLEDGDLNAWRGYLKWAECVGRRVDREMERHL